MTSRYTPLFDAIALLEANHQAPNLVPAVKNFPFHQMYIGQKEILEQIPTGGSAVICSHTGMGKTAIFLTLTRNTPSIIIEPRIFLQRQTAKYFNDTLLFGRSGYQCRHAHSAATAPCLLKENCSDTQFHRTCEKATQTCLNDECTVFPISESSKRSCVFEWGSLCGESDGTRMASEDIEDNNAPCGFRNPSECTRYLPATISSYQIYPCEECKYISAQREAIRVFRNNGTVICNFGNFWNLLKSAKLVVVDEADLFFREISAPMRLKYSTPKQHSGNSIKELMDREVDGLQKAAKDKDAGFRYKAQNLLYSAQFLFANADLCFKYQRKDRIYIEIDPRNVNILSQKLFKDKRVIIVSATPGQFDLPSYSASIHQRCGLFFAPVGNLTSRSLKINPYIMNQAARAIVEISNHFDMMYDNTHVIIHCTNLGTHAAAMYKILGKDDCVLHSSGKLAETIQEYLKSKKRYLLAASAEYGFDASFSKLQFILKHPFPNLDERARTLQKVMGPEFNAYYESSARIRTIQMAGRVGRGFDDFGCTICLDSKSKEDYEKNQMQYPDWYRNRVDSRCY